MYLEYSTKSPNPQARVISSFFLVKKLLSCSLNTIIIFSTTWRSRQNFAVRCIVNKLLTALTVQTQSVWRTSCCKQRQCLEKRKTNDLREFGWWKIFFSQIFWDPTLTRGGLYIIVDTQSDTKLLHRSVVSP